MLTHTEALIRDIRFKLDGIGRQFIFDGTHDTAQMLTQMKYIVQNSLQEMIGERIEDFVVYEPVGHLRNTLKVVIQPSLSVERIVVDLVTNP